MKDAYNPHGAALMDCFRGDPAATLMCYQDGERNDVPASFWLREMIDPLETLALDLCRGHVLDVGAGSGLYSLELQRWEIKVTAIDVAPNASSSCGNAAFVARKWLTSTNLMAALSIRSPASATAWTKSGGLLTCQDFWSGCVNSWHRVVSSSQTYLICGLVPMKAALLIWPAKQKLGATSANSISVLSTRARRCPILSASG